MLRARPELVNYIDNMDVPWGNLSIFYQDFRYSDSLIMLGHIDAGRDVIFSMEEDFSVILEK
mgnify:FL=1